MTFCTLEKCKLKDRQIAEKCKLGYREPDCWRGYADVVVMLIRLRFKKRKV